MAGIDWHGVLIHGLELVGAFLLALPIGWNREKRQRTAGLRTFPLVAVASCGFVQAALSQLGSEPEPVARILAGVITGIGFIGGGAILQTKETVKGTATAASLWITAAIGAGVGMGSYDVAVLLAIITFLTLKVLTPVKDTIEGEQTKEDP